MTQQRIVIGVDFEQDGDIALLEALRIADRSGTTELHVVHALEPDERRIDHNARALERALSELRVRTASLVWPEGGAYDLRLHVRFGAPAEVLHSVAVDYDADLLVVGTHARRGVARVVLGSVAETLVRTARLPVVVARRKDFSGIARTPVPTAAGDEGLELHRSQLVSEAIRIHPRSAHISGLV